MKKIAFLLTFLITIQGCGYTPAYVSNGNLDFKIKSINYEGDQELNHYISIRLKRYVSKNSNNSGLKISAKTDYKKHAQSRNEKGNITSFKAQSSVTFLVNADNQTFNFIYYEQSDLNNLDDTFELKLYEKSIKQNFAFNMVEKLKFDLFNNQ